MILIKKILILIQLKRQQQQQIDKIQSGQLGYGAKFILDYNKQLIKLNDITLSGYKAILNKFDSICKDLEEPKQ